MPSRVSRLVLPLGLKKKEIKQKTNKEKKTKNKETNKKNTEKETKTKKPETIATQASISEDNARDWKILRKINSWPRSDRSFDDCEILRTIS